MSKSSRVAQNYIPKVRLALRRSGFPSQRAFATEMGMCRNTICNFVNGRPVQHNYFVDISDKLGLNWEAIVYIEPSLSVEADEADIVPNPPQNQSETNIYILLANLVEVLKQATQASEAASYTAQLTLKAMRDLIDELKQRCDRSDRSPS